MKAQKVTREAPFQRECAWCGNPFAAASSQAAYCCTAHKQAHYRWRAKIGKFGREAIVRIEYLSGYVAKGGEIQEVAERQLRAIVERAAAVIWRSSAAANLKEQRKNEK